MSAPPTIGCRTRTDTARRSWRSLARSLRRANRTLVVPTLADVLDGLRGAVRLRRRPGMAGGALPFSPRRLEPYGVGNGSASLSPARDTRHGGWHWLHHKRQADPARDAGRFAALHGGLVRDCAHSIADRARRVQRRGVLHAQARRPHADHVPLPRRRLRPPGGDNASARHGTTGIGKRDLGHAIHLADPGRVRHRVPGRATTLRPSSAAAPATTPG